MRPGRRNTRIALLGGIIAVLIVATATVCAVRWLHAYKAESLAYREAHSAVKIVGKTPDQVIAQFGTPDSWSHEKDGRVSFITYKQVTHGQYCFIAFKNGMAQQVTFDFQ